jgi:hypothetical protein
MAAISSSSSTSSSTSSSGVRARIAISLLRSILVAGLAIGVIGSVEFGAFYYVTEKIGPVTLYQFIASGLMGPAAFAGGYATALLGVLIHFAISFVVAAVFLLAAVRIRLLRRTLFLSALVYGSAVNLFMSMAVLPFTAVPRAPVTLALLLNGLIGDAFFIGLPLAIVVWWNTHTVTICARPWLEDSQVAVSA